MLKVAINQDLLDQRIDLAAATEYQVNAARTSALRKFRKRFETRVKRAAAKELRLPIKAIGDRFFSSSVEPGDEELKLWIGTWDVSPFSIGSPQAYGVPGKSGGVKVGRRRYLGAFLGRIYSGKDNVWIRLHSKHYSPELYPTKHRPGDRGLAGGGRFPVLRAAVPIDDTIAKVLATDGEEFAREFETLFFQELNYQVNVKGARS